MIVQHARRAEGAGVVMVGRVHGWHRRQAVQIVSQLPEATSDAVIVLELAKHLVEGFLAEPAAQPEALERDSVVVAFSSCPPNSASR